MTNGVFSDYELREMGIKFDGEEEYTAANCVGSCEEEMESKVISKKCRGDPRSPLSFIHDPLRAWGQWPPMH